MLMTLNDLFFFAGGIAAGYFGPKLGWWILGKLGALRVQ